MANLTYEWSAPTGSFSGTGPIVTWTPGADAVTPADFVVTLTVTERYASGAATLENKVTGTVTAHVNNSPKELADLSLRFLDDFATSSVSPDTVRLASSAIPAAARRTSSPTSTTTATTS